MNEQTLDSDGSSERDLIRRAFGQADATPVSGDPPPIEMPEAQSFEGYEILRPIHRGGQGAVYLAIQKATKRRVAIKVLHGGPFAGSTGKARFEREIQILGQLNHPNIVKIHDSGQTPTGEFFYVMDYISGRGLDELARAGEERAAIPEVLALFARLCEGVNAAHLRGVIHRDLKPQNIRVDSSGEPIVVDFGLAKVGVPDVVEDEESGSAHMMSMTGQFVGSLPWASPEQATGSPGEIDMRSDVYSLGVVLYQLLTGRFPYEVVGNMRDVLDNILKAEPARPSTIRRQINDEVETIILKCLHKDKDRRYQSAGDLARDIRRYLNGEPIEAKRDSGWYVISKSLKRYRGRVAALGVIALLVVGWSISSTVLLANEREARRAAVKATGAAEAARVGEAEQRGIAEANADRVRESFRLFVEDFDKRLRRLRGTTRVREEMLALLFSHVDELEDAGDKDLADGKELIATILAGIHYAPTVGRSGEAAPLIDEAIVHRRAVLAENDQDPEAHADLAQTLAARGGLAHMQKRFDDASAAYVEALGALDRGIALADDADALKDQRAWVRRLSADAIRSSVQQRNENLDRLDALRQALVMYQQIEAYWDQKAGDSDSWDVLRELGVTRDKIGLTWLLIARLRVDQAEIDAEQDVGERLDQAFEDLRAATAHVEAAHASLERAQSQSRQNDQIRRDLMLNRRRLGMIWRETNGAVQLASEHGLPFPERFGEPQVMQRQTLAVFEEVLDATVRLVGYEREAQLRADVENLDLSKIDSVQAWRDVVIALNTVGNARKDMGRLDECLAAYQVSLTICQLLVQADPNVRYQSDLVVGYTKIGDHAEASAMVAIGEAREALLQDAIAWYERARVKLGEMVSDGSVEPAHVHIAAVTGKLEQLRAKLADGG